MAAQDYTGVVQQLYVSYFGRPADYFGLQNFTKQLDAMGAPKTFAELSAAVQSEPNGALAQLVGNFSNSPESIALYGNDNSELGTSKFVTAIYKNFLGREPDLEGYQFWVNAIQSGGLDKANAAAAITQGALANTTAQGLKDAKVVANKLAVATSFTDALDTPSEFNAYAGDAAAATARALLQGVNDTTNLTTYQTNVNTAVNAIVGNAAVGTTFTLTSAIDNVVGTAGDDTIIGDRTSTNPADQIDGGAGNDTLKLTGFGDAAFTTLPASIKNVENIVLVGNMSAAVDLSATSGVTNVTLENNSIATAITGMTSAQTLGLTNVSDNTKAIGATVSGGSASLKLSGSKDAGVVTFTGATAALSTVNVNSTGSVANKVAGLAVVTGSLKTLNVTGEQGLTVTGLLADTVTKIDASASTGATNLKTAATLVADLAVTGGAGANTLTVGAGGGKAVTVALGAGNDKLTLGDLSTYGVTSTFVGGEGTDTIVIVDGSKLTAATGKQISGFETLDLAGGTGIYDVALLAAGNTISTIQVGGALVGAATVKNVATGSAVNVLASDTAALTVEVKDALTTTTDSLSFNIGGQAAVVSTALTALEVETITLNSTSSAAGWSNATDKNVVTSLVADKATTLNITGDKSLELTGATAAALTKIDASAFTGNFVMGAATAATSILGGTGNDTLIASVAGSTINAGKGNDNITLGAAKDVLIYNAGDALAVVKAGVLDTASLETVTGFTSGVDVIDLGSFGFTGTAQSALASKGALTTLPAADVASFFVDAGVTRGVATGTNGGNTYVFVDADKDGNFDVASDLVIVVASPVNFADIGF